MNKVITITGVETKQTSNGKTILKIKDQEGKNYQLWPIKQDGTESLAYQFYKTLPSSGVNHAVELFYKEEQGNYQGKPVTYRTILGMNEAAAPVKQQETQNTIPEPQIIKDPDWDKIRQEKEENIRWCNALNNACLLVANSKYNTELHKTVELAVMNLANWLYKLESKDDEIIIPDDDNDDLKLEDIPF